ncbi:hypothetical protein Patl1_08351 [Pistacia atlantica]|uniref:Uncharacterized protein n=1 Tax=Pistacia atlantica TaxID=434234 RepID=A0ACC1AKN9_9ROSI|nr:hypothetical protein Patl1_08351 [Pistacia atlantica]
MRASHFQFALSWKGSAPEAQNEAADNQQSTIVFPKGNPKPSVKALTFYKGGTFTVDVQYVDVSELQAPHYALEQFRDLFAVYCGGLGWKLSEDCTGRKTYFHSKDCNSHDALP